MSQRHAKTLVLMFHPDVNRSRANKALSHAAAALEGVTVADVRADYPDGRIDTDAEVERLLGAQRIVLQFPIQWYSTPPLLKAWQDVVLTRMFYMNYQNEGRLLEGRPLLVAATAGNKASTYAETGSNLCPLEALLSPLRVTAHRCGLAWADPFLLYEANTLPTTALAEAAADYATRLRTWIATAA
ncbi:MULTISPECIES: NAD(P)H-dependent oxidoreductase [unclassified Chelatococcus]|uniref:NAD(P)H-dependent oxidoreductase n=1 Tax=unclassified Chelatococcus TaxID=2638111 RepID=UPI001BCAD049|nr:MULTISPECIES: NAD(P)H-dependent oxidoreductase [unclassified Chelatococcus]MBS7700882.1 NAD(P)H-dependent oxidoreductase [Chelatococcus sp. YT9]MBX3555415.1 NAD(P)H-dependent oxidoreductase [Chelatococcus sp.]